MKATLAQRSASWPAGTEHTPAGGEVLPRLQPARRRRPARTADRQAPRPPLRLVATDGRVVRPAPGDPVRTDLDAQAVRDAAAVPSASPQPAALRPAALAAAQSAAPDPAPAPLRLTRRGRLVVTGMAVLLVAAVSVGLAGAAQALGHSPAPARPGTAGTAGTAGAAITKVEVRPGQSLWTLAEAYDPNADTRQVIQEILQLNSMSTDQVQPGQILWMPRD